MKVTLDMSYTGRTSISTASAGYTNYWIIGVGPIVNQQYTWAVVSGPFRKSLYILGRTRFMPPSTLFDILLHLQRLQFDVSSSRLVLTDQLNCSLS